MVVFHAAPHGRRLAANISFPIDSSSRAFRRAQLDVNFPIKKLDSTSVNLKHAPVELRWRSSHCVESHGGAGSPRREVGGDRGGGSGAPESLVVDPHKAGFGSIAESIRRRPPPPCPIREGFSALIPEEGHVAGSEVGVVGTGAGMESILLGVFLSMHLGSVMETIPI